MRFEAVTLTYGEWDAQANRVANALHAAGLDPGSRVAVMLTNRPEFLAAWAGIAKAGMVEVPVNTAYKGYLLAYLLEHAQCERADRRGAVDSTGWPPSRTRCPVCGRWSCSMTRRRVSARSGPSPGRTSSPARRRPPRRSRSTRRTCRRSSTRRAPPGPSKGVVLTHAANFYMARNVVELMDYGKRRRRVQRLPAVPRQRALLGRAAGDVRRRRVRAALAVQRQRLLGHLPRPGCHRLQLHGRPADDAVQATGARRRRGQPGAARVRCACAGHDLRRTSSDASACNWSRSTARPRRARSR